jgi:hypothetical protein
MVVWQTRDGLGRGASPSLGVLARRAKTQKVGNGVSAAKAYKVGGKHKARVENYTRYYTLGRPGQIPDFT